MKETIKLDLSMIAVTLHASQAAQIISKEKKGRGKVVQSV